MPHIEKLGQAWLIVVYGDVVLTEADLADIKDGAIPIGLYGPIVVRFPQIKRRQGMVVIISDSIVLNDLVLKLVSIHYGILFDEVEGMTTQEVVNLLRWGTPTFAAITLNDSNEWQVIFLAEPIALDVHPVAILKAESVRVPRSNIILTNPTHLIIGALVQLIFR